MFEAIYYFRACVVAGDGVLRCIALAKVVEWHECWPALRLSASVREKKCQEKGKSVKGWGGSKLLPSNSSPSTLQASRITMISFTTCTATYMSRCIRHSDEGRKSP